ncbi:MAG: hypothetical protein D6744_06605 [Planctomycetota bacterium]|nr:MAG: hypothetical protein D6744_06605 [Planctomycetota bacterium]
MYDFQAMLFRSAATWSAATSSFVFLLGMLYCLQGFRFARFLLALTCGGSGFVLGMVGGKIAGIDPLVAGGACALGLGVVSLQKLRAGVVISSIITFAAVFQYLAVRVGVYPDYTLISGAFGALVGAAVPFMFRRSMPVVLTTLQGGLIAIVGFVGLASRLAPALAETFISWSHHVSLMVPALYAMLVTLGVSVQANARQGDLQSGGAGLQAESDYS